MSARVGGEGRPALGPSLPRRERAGAVPGSVSKRRGRGGSGAGSAAFTRRGVRRGACERRRLGGGRAWRAERSGVPAVWPSGSAWVRSGRRPRPPQRLAPAPGLRGGGGGYGAAEAGRAGAGGGGELRLPALPGGGSGCCPPACSPSPRPGPGPSRWSGSWCGLPGGGGRWRCRRSGCRRGSQRLGTPGAAPQGPAFGQRSQCCRAAGTWSK